MRAWGLLGLLVLAVAALPARGQVALEWKLKKGDKFYVESVVTSRQALEVKGKTTTHSSTATTAHSFEVVGQEGGNFVLKWTIEGFRLKGEEKSGADDKPKTEDPSLAAATRAGNRAKGMTFTVTLAPSGKVVKFEGYEEELKKVVGTSETGEKAFRSEFPPEDFLVELTTFFGFLPDAPVTPGTTWKRPEKIEVGGRGSLSGETAYTYKGKGEGGEQITLNSTLSYAPPKEVMKQAKISNVKIEPATGTIVFDSAAGRLVGQKRDLTLQATVAVTDANNRTTTYNLRQETSRTVRLADKSPL